MKNRFLPLMIAVAAMTGSGVAFADCGGDPNCAMKPDGAGALAIGHKNFNEVCVLCNMANSTDGGTDGQASTLPGKTAGINVNPAASKTKSGPGVE